VKFTVRFRGREITHPQVAQVQLQRILAQLEEIANVEVRPAMEQRTMTLLVAPKPAVMQRVAQARALAEKARQQGKHHEEQAAKDDAIAKLEQQLSDRDEAEGGHDDDDDDDEGEGEAKSDAERSRTSKSLAALPSLGSPDAPPLARKRGMRGVASS
jgi:translation initiation factor IF-3